MRIVNSHHDVARYVVQHVHGVCAGDAWQGGRKQISWSEAGQVQRPTEWAGKGKG